MASSPGLGSGQCLVAADPGTRPRARFANIAEERVMSDRLTLDEAAVELRTKKRWLNDWLLAHPTDSADLPYYTPVGRKKIFHPSDIARIEFALREELKSRSVSGRRAPVKRRILKSEARTDEAAWKLAAELLNDPTLLPKSSG